MARGADESGRRRGAGAGPGGSHPHAGHRQRLRARFRKGGADGLHDYELLELLLFNAIPQRDVKPLAKALIAQFGTLADVLAAPKERLAEITVPVEGKAALAVTERVQDEFAVIRAVAVAFAKGKVIGRPVLSSWSDLLAYCRSAMAYDATEHFRVLFLNTKNALIADEVMSRGTVNQTAVYPRDVVKRALALDAAAVILVHNHPSGDPTPSRADIEMTARIVDATKSIGVSVHDHLVIGRGREASFKGLGLL